MARTTIRPLILLALWLAAGLGATEPPTTVWTAVAVDPKGDGRTPEGIDTAQLSYQFDNRHDRLWFRLSLFKRLTYGPFTVDLAIDTGLDDAHRTAWWGTNTTFTFDRLLTARVTYSNGTYHAVASIRQALGSTSSPAVTQEEVDVRVTDDSILLGVKRAALLDSSMKMKLVAAIGLDEAWNDDIPNARFAAIDLNAPRPARGLREIDVSRNNLRFPPGQPRLADTSHPRITERGHGRRAVILIPGVYSGETVFDGFIARNQAAYTFLVLTPPGLNGTPARELPSEHSSIGEFTWTRRLARDILELIARRHLAKPIIVAHGFPGTLAAEQLATSHPHLLGGVVEVAGLSPQFFPSPADPRRAATAAERIAVVDDSWARFWFKYVTPGTWESNNYPAEMFANDPERAERARRQVESAPLPVKIRYLMESMASDQQANLDRLGAPVMALVPGFNHELLTNPVFAWFKTSFQDGWEPMRGRPRLELVSVANARALMLDDQPSLTDAAVNDFIERTMQQ